MGTPLRWAVGDRCVCRGRVGRVWTIDGSCAGIRWPDGTWSGARLDELSLVPESDPSHSSHGDLGALLTLEERP